MADIIDLKKAWLKRQAAEYLGCKERTLNKYLYETYRYKIRHFKYMGRIYFDPKDIEALKRQLIQVRSR